MRLLKNTPYGHLSPLLEGPAAECPFTDRLADECIDTPDRLALLLVTTN